MAVMDDCTTMASYRVLALPYQDQLEHIKFTNIKATNVKNNWFQDFFSEIDCTLIIDDSEDPLCERIVNKYLAADGFLSKVYDGITKRELYNCQIYLSHQAKIKQERKWHRILNVTGDIYDRYKEIIYNIAYSKRNGRGRNIMFDEQDPLLLRISLLENLLLAILENINYGYMRTDNKSLLETLEKLLKTLDLIKQPLSEKITELKDEKTSYEMKKEEYGIKSSTHINRLSQNLNHVTIKSMKHIFDFLEQMIRLVSKIDCDTMPNKLADIEKYYADFMADFMAQKNTDSKFKKMRVEEKTKMRLRRCSKKY